MKAKEVKQILGITQPTLSKYVREGKIGITKINDFNYFYNPEDVYALIGLKKTKKEKCNVIYSRISNQSRKKDVELQTNRIKNFCLENSIVISKVFEDVKSGISFDRKEFDKLIELIIKGEVGLIVIENKDRLVRFGFELIEKICRFYGTKIIVINNLASDKTYEEELTEDLLSIIHYFSMKSYSHRRKLNKLSKEISNDNFEVENK